MMEVFGTGGGGGHTILDANGNEMPQRGKMQFKRFSVEDDSTNNVTIIQPKDFRIFAVHYSENNSDPDSCDYPYGYDNYGWTPFSMNLSTGVPNYGSWDPSGDNADFVKFIFPRSCMLKYDGTVDYYLNENDETKKEDGTASDVADTSYGGNAMMEWGQDGKKLYWKILPDSDDKGWTFIVADKAVNRYGNPDPDMRPWNHYDCNGNVAAHWYTPKYFGSLVNGRLRSISGQTNSTNKTAQEEIDYARANNLSSVVLWDTEVYADWMFTAFMCILLSKSLNSQAKFGAGVSSNSTAIQPGALNTKGLFYGKSGSVDGVKLFGMENPYGNMWRRIRGLVISSSTIKAKITHGTEDGSTATDYNVDGTGYIEIGGNSSQSGYMSSMTKKKYGLFPKSSGGFSGSENTYYADHTYLSTGSGKYAMVGGGYSSVGAYCGIFCCALDESKTNRKLNGGAALSCKPLA